MKKLIIAIILGTAVPFATFARPHGHFGGHHPPPMHHHGYHHHHGSGYFWGGVAAGALLGTAIAAPVVYRSPVVYTPVVAPTPVSTRVWIPPRVETRYDSWGRPYTVTIPGYWTY